MPPTATMTAAAMAAAAAAGGGVPARTASSSPVAGGLEAADAAVARARLAAAQVEVSSVSPTHRHVRPAADRSSGRRALAAAVRSPRQPQPHQYQQETSPMAAAATAHHGSGHLDDMHSSSSSSPSSMGRSRSRSPAAMRAGDDTMDIMATAMAMVSPIGLARAPAAAAAAAAAPPTGTTGGGIGVPAEMLQTLLELQELQAQLRAQQSRR